MRIEPSILFEDQDIAVINKPAGIVTNQAETVREVTIQSWWMDRLRQQHLEWPKDWEHMVPENYLVQYGTPEEVFGQRGGIVHRLDKDTSGALVLAKHPGALAALLSQFRLREVEKKYVCLVHGRFQIPEGVLQLPLGRNPRQRTQYVVDATGRPAETYYRVQKVFRSLQKSAVEELAQQTEMRQYRKKIDQNYQGFSLVLCQPKTGRTHQLRVHLNHVHHPIVADPIYLGRKRFSLDETWCPRLFLHAQMVSIMHPRTRKKIEVTAPLSPELEIVLNKMELEEDRG